VSEDSGTDALRGGLEAALAERTRTWLVTGAAGFIGSHLVERLLSSGQRVRGIDDFSTGSEGNLEDVRRRVGEEAWGRFDLLRGTICEPDVCAESCDGVEHVLHMAALGSVPRSVKDPLATHRANVDGFVHVLLAARDANVSSLVYASSSSVYGDHPDLPKVEGKIGEPLSPYAASKRIDEVFASAFQRSYGLPLAGLRYFNVFGPRQDPDGPYAAVIPRWIRTLCAGDVPHIFGDGETSRDFCPVANVVQVNLRAALAPDARSARVFNVALGGRTSLVTLFARIRDGLLERGFPVGDVEPVFEPEREGDVRHSLADVSFAREALGYEPEVDFDAGLATTLDWFVERLQAGATP